MKEQRLYSGDEKDLSQGPKSLRIDENEHLHRKAMADEKKTQREKRREENEHAYKKAVADEKKTQRRKSAALTDELTRRRNFTRATLFGPIFICSCCHRKLFENGVTKVTETFKNKLSDKKVPYSVDIPSKQEVQVNISLNDSTSLSGIYICHTWREIASNGSSK